jgi:dienelactone hydrolase
VGAHSLAWATELIATTHVMRGAAPDASGPTCCQSASMDTAEAHPAASGIAVSRSLLTRLIVLGLGIALMAVGGLGLLRLESDLVVSHTVLPDGTPVVTRALPGIEAGEGRAAVVIHGYTASGTIVGMLAASLARAGFVVAVPDLIGHGRNQAPYPDGDERLALIDAQMVRVIDALAADRRVDRGAGVHLVGHSLGAIAVARVDPDRTALAVRSAVLVSTPSGTEIPNNVPTTLMYGALEPATFVEAADQGARRLEAAGVETQVISVPAVEHVGIILSPMTAHAAIRWFNGQTGAQPTPFDVRSPVAPLVLVVVGLLVVAAPLSRFVLGPPPASARGPRLGSALAWIAVALVAGAAAGWASAPLQAAFPLAVGGYLVAMFLITGVVLWLLRRRWVGGQPDGDGQPRDPHPWRTTIGGLALTALVISVLALSAQRSWSAFDLSGSRRWALPVLEVALLTFFMAETMVVRRASAVRHAALMVAGRLLLVVVMIAAVVQLEAPRILYLQVPLIGILLAVTGWWGYHVSRHSPEPWIVATVQAIPIAYVVASALPLQG